MAANLVFKNGFYQTDSRSFNDSELKSALVSFVSQNKVYKMDYLQKEFPYGFDGYSFQGQEDSSNQYPSDRLHSFVISDFITPSRFPKEFQSFYSNSWNSLQLKIRQLELEIIELIDIPGLKAFYEKNIGHMISCNYYPQITETTLPNEQKNRLSTHIDVSLFTVFPFGFDQDFYFENASGNWVNIPATQDIIVFPGYLMEVFTNGTLKALNHKVKLPENENRERFSFAYFSLPYPQKKFVINEHEWTSETYFKKYLDLF